MEPYLEEQRFSRAYFYALILGPGLGIGLLLGLGMYLQVGLGHPFGNRPLSNEQLVLFSSLTIGLLAAVSVLFLIIRFRVRIDNQGIWFRYFPFQLHDRHLPWSQVAKIEVQRYRPYADFGGYGIAIRRRVKAYTVSGNRALSITLTNGQRYLLGTRKTQPLKVFLTQVLGKSLHTDQDSAAYATT